MSQKMATLIKAEQARDCFDLDAENGILYWKKVSKHHREKLGKPAGNQAETHNGKYYWLIQWNGRKWKRGHLVYLIVNGELPKPMVDHINGNSLDDRPSNLRCATATQNAWNHHKRKRKIQLPMGVRMNPSGTFAARITCNKKQMTIGTFLTPEEASSAYQLKRKELYGDFS